MVWPSAVPATLPGAWLGGYATNMVSEQNAGVQLGIFDKAAEVLDGGVVYRHSFIGRAEADSLYAAFSKLNWQQHSYRKTGLAPRMYVWMGIPHAPPRLANKLVLTDWTAEATRVKERVEEATRSTFDSLNFNLYRNERDEFTN